MDGIPVRSRWSISGSASSNVCRHSLTSDRAARLLDLVDVCHQVKPTKRLHCGSFSMIPAAGTPKRCSALASGHPTALLRLTAAAIFGFVLAWPSPLNAQVSPPPPPDPQRPPRMKLGGFLVQPSIALTNVGIDSNVFNSVEDPERDFTATLSSTLAAWGKVGRVSLTTMGKGDLVYFQRFSTERSIDGGAALQASLPLGRLAPFAEVGAYSGRQRINFDIDVRSRRTQLDLALGVNVRVGGKSTVGLSARRTTTGWSGDSAIGNGLREALDRTSNTGTVAYRHSLTPLTTWVNEVAATTDRFQFSPQRDSDSVAIQSGFDLNSRALISGTARVGYRRLDPRGGFAPHFRGPISKATLSYHSPIATQVDLNVGRDTGYSYEQFYPYFIDFNLNATVTQRIVGPLDFQINAGRRTMDYQLTSSAPPALPARKDRVNQFGLGFGWRLPGRSRLGFTLDRVQRSSPSQTRDYKGYRFGSSLTYLR